MAYNDDDYDSGAADYVAGRLIRGHKEEYLKVQGLVLNALQTGNWVYGNQIMKIIWALLPEEAQARIGETREVKPGL